MGIKCIGQVQEFASDSQDTNRAYYGPKRPNICPWNLSRKYPVTFKSDKEIQTDLKNSNNVHAHLNASGNIPTCVKMYTSENTRKH